MKTQNKRFKTFLILSILISSTVIFLSCETKKNTSASNDEKRAEVDEEEMIIEQPNDESETDVQLKGTWEVEHSKFINDGEMGEEMKPLAPTFWVFKNSEEMNIENTSVMNLTYEFEDSVLSIKMGQDPLVYKILTLNKTEMELRTIKQDDYSSETYIKLVKVD